MIVRNQDQNFLKALTVLYVEDEPETREQFSAFLRRPVGTLITAVNGAEGLEAFVRHAPDIVVTDILMPYMDGLDMAGEIRKIAPAVPIIVVTAFENTEYLMRAIEIGVDKYVVKPVVSNLLLERLLECAHRLRAEEQLELVHQHEIQEMAAKHQRHHDELRIIFELSTAGILLGDDQGLITFASGRMAEMLGYSADELANTRYIDHVHPDDLRGVTENMQRLLTGKVRNIDSEHRYMRKDGSYFWGHLTASCIEDESKTLVVVLSDVGVRKRAEEERLKLEHQLLHAQKLESVGVLAGGIAHDFNNVLTVINGYANLLQTTIKDDDESQLFAREISDSVCRAADMTRSILAFSGKHEMLMKYDDLNQILSN
ncbi:MAG: response regulator, partial [Desulfuromonadales bacterium]